MVGEDGQDVADALLVGELVGEWLVGVHCVVVAAAVAFARDVAAVGEFGDDVVGGALGDPDAVADLAQTDPGVLRDAEQYAGVVG